MPRIAGAFNTDNAVARVIRALEAMQCGNDAPFWVCTEDTEVNARRLQELKELAPLMRESEQCIACCSGKPVLLGDGLKNRFVADAELYYGLDEVKTRYQCGGSSSSEVLAELVAKGLHDARVDGAYAYAYWVRDTAPVVYLARDIIGLRPLYFAHTHGFAFASEKKGLEAMAAPHAIELDPRTILEYHGAEDRVIFTRRAFFETLPTHTGTMEEQKATLLTLLRASIRRRIPPGETFGLLFSGGLDSTLLAYLCQELGGEFVCYTVAVEDPKLKVAEDLGYARSIAADLGLELRIKQVRVEDIERCLATLVPLVDNPHGVTISVAVPLYLACEQAKADGVQTVLYGLGTEELFAGYERYKQVNERELNRACQAGLMAMHERDLSRDDVIATALGVSLRAPFLAHEVVDYALKIPAAYKLLNGENKLILREIAADLGLEKVAWRKKRAVQYGSNVMKAIERLAKQAGYRYTREYLRSFYPSRAIKLGCLFSSGKDSTFALWLMQKAGYPIECLITLKSRNPASYMFHTPAVELVELQAEAIGIPLVLRETEGEKELELEDLRAALREAKARYRIEGVISGALWSTYQKDRIERIAHEEGLKVFAPLWHMNQETELRVVVSTFEVIFTSISAYGLDKSWLGRTITSEDVDRLVEIARGVCFDRARGEQDREYPYPLRRAGWLNIAGEGGEFESLVLDGPIFKKKLVLVDWEIEAEDMHTARVVVHEARLDSKRW